MWARIMEFMLGCFLAISPFIFSYESDDYFFFISSFVGASLLITFSLLSYYPKLSKIHLCNLIVSLFLLAVAIIMDKSPKTQNYAVLGLILLMLNIIPSNASHPPKKWEDYYKKL